MTKSTFKDISFLEVLSWVAVHSQTMKYLEIISTPRFGEVFQNSIKGVGEKSPHPSGVTGVENFVEGRDFFIGWWNLFES